MQAPSLHIYAPRSCTKMPAHAAMRVVGKQNVVGFVRATDNQVGRATAAYCPSATVSASVDCLGCLAERRLRKLNRAHLPLWVPRPVCRRRLSQWVVDCWAPRLARPRRTPITRAPSRVTDFPCFMCISPRSALCVSRCVAGGRADLTMMVAPGWAIAGVGSSAIAAVGIPLTEVGRVTRHGAYVRVQRVHGNS